MAGTARRLSLKLNFYNLFINSLRNLYNFFCILTALKVRRRELFFGENQTREEKRWISQANMKLFIPGASDNLAAGVTEKQ